MPDLKLVSDGSQFAQNLCCPHCDGNFIHHGRIDIFERADDAAVGLHTVVNEYVTQVDGEMGGNPSRRRTGLKIAFHCEHCGKDAVLKIAQHKGQTEIAWE